MSQGQVFGPGFDLKRGRGGIREIEFFAQIHQLIHGGREPALRAPATLDALAALKAAGRIAGRRRRRPRRRLSAAPDRSSIGCRWSTTARPTALPADPAALDNVARLHGLGYGEALLGLWKRR